MTIFGRQCLLLVLAPASPALPHAVAYLRIRALSLLPALWASVGFAALRGAQDTKTPLKIAAASNLLNAALDPLLIFGGLGVRALGVAGAAAATALAEIASGAAYLAILSRRNLMPLRSALARAPSLAQLWPLLSAGGALQFRNLCLNLAFLFATRTAQLADSTGVQAAAFKTERRRSLKRLSSLSAEADSDASQMS
ncbi:MAG: polysaccharide biosynthesis C-terminal domain-containing protein, partial [Promethearchaeia archaeon]